MKPDTVMYFYTVCSIVLISQHAVTGSSTTQQITTGGLSSTVQSFKVATSSSNGAATGAVGVSPSVAVTVVTTTANTVGSVSTETNNFVSTEHTSNPLVTTSVSSSIGSFKIASNNPVASSSSPYSAGSVSTNSITIEISSDSATKGGVELSTSKSTTAASNNESNTTTTTPENTSDRSSAATTSTFAVKQTSELNVSNVSSHSERSTMDSQTTTSSPPASIGMSTKVTNNGPTTGLPKASTDIPNSTEATKREELSPTYDRDLAIVFGSAGGLMVLVIVVMCVLKVRRDRRHNKFTRGGGDIEISMSKF